MDTKECRECSAGPYIFFTVGVLAALVFVLVGGVVIGLAVGERHRGVEGRQASTSQLRQDRYVVSLGILVFGFQTMGLFSVLDLSWPQSSKALLDVALALTPGWQILGGQCVTGSFHGMYAITSILFLGVLAGTPLVVLALRQWGGRWSVKLDSLRHVSLVWLLRATWFIIVPLVYVPVAAGSLLVFDCTRLPTGGRIVLSVDSSVTCYEGLWWMSALFGLLWCVGFVLAVPAYVGWVLWTRRSVLFDDGTVQQIGFMYQNWTRKAFYGELVNYGRRMSVVVVVVFLTDEPIVQATLLMSSLLLWMGFVLSKRPYYVPLFNTVEIVVTGCLAGMLLVGMGSFTNRHQSTNVASEVFVTCCVALAACALIGVGGWALYFDMVSLKKERAGEVSWSEHRKQSLSVELGVLDHDVDANPPAPVFDNLLIGDGGE